MAARGLGKGLDSLIPNALGETKTKKEAVAKAKSEATTEEKEPQTLVKITKVEPNREQPRKNFDEDALQELADSIKQFGLLQPILVQDRKDYYEIIAGERRWRAAKLAGLKEVPVIIRNYTEQEIVEISLIENIQREDLNPIEEAQAYKRLLTEFHLKQDEVAERVSKSRAAVTNSIRLLKLNEDVQRMVVDEMISTGHARALLAVENPEEQYNLAQRIFDEKLSVRDVEKLVKNLHKPEKPKKTDDKTMQEAFRSGFDIHTATAAQVFGVEPEQVTPLMRRHAKAVNFGIVYGISEFSLSEDIGVTRKEARQYIDNYLAHYAGVRTYMHEIVEQAKRDGYVTTLFGRRRELSELKSSNFNIRSFGERVALNTPIQGTAADIIKLAMIRVDAALRKQKLKARLVLQVHDELIVECPIKEAEQVKKIVTAEMENVVRLNVPLLAEAKSGASWYEAK